MEIGKVFSIFSCEKWSGEETSDNSIFNVFFERKFMGIKS